MENKLEQRIFEGLSEKNLIKYLYLRDNFSSEGNTFFIAYILAVSDLMLFLSFYVYTHSKIFLTYIAFASALVICFGICLFFLTKYLEPKVLHNFLLKHQHDRD